MEYYKNLDINDIKYFCEVDLIEKTEQWKDIKGFEGVYEISDLGRVKSLERYTNHYKGGLSLQKQFIKKSSIVKGYLVNGLTKNGITKSLKTHRLVADAFIPNPENKPQVNHKKGNKKDNRFFMLEWSTNKENVKHAYKTGLHKGSHLGLKGIMNSKSKPVIQYDLNGVFIKEYDSISAASSQTNVFAQNISYACNGKYKQANGFLWKHKQ
jgi:hypothetical protein